MATYDFDTNFGKKNNYTGGSTGNTNTSSGYNNTAGVWTGVTNVPAATGGQNYTDKMGNLIQKSGNSYIVGGDSYGLTPGTYVYNPTSGFWEANGGKNRIDQGVVNNWTATGATQATNHNYVQDQAWRDANGMTGPALGTPGSTGYQGSAGNGTGYPNATGFPYGNIYGDVEGVTNALGDRVFSNYDQYSGQALQGMTDSYNKGANLLDGEYTDRYNAYNELLDELNAKLNAGYDEMQSYMPGAQAAADMAQGNLGTLQPLLAEQQNAYYDMGRDMDALRAAYQNVLNGTVPEETKANLEQIYANQMGQASMALNNQYEKDLATLVDNLGGRGILSSTTSSQAQTGLNENLMRELQNAEYEYGTQKLQELIATPYKQFDAATQLYNSSGQLVSAAGDVLNGGLGIQNAYNQNADNYLGLANQANANYNSLINSANSQASYGRSSLDALIQQINAYNDQGQLARGIYGDVTNPAMDMWAQLIGAETSRITSAQASGGGGDSSSGAWGLAAAVAPTILDAIF